MHKVKWSPNPESRQPSSNKKRLRLYEEDKENVVPEPKGPFSKLKSPVSSKALSSQIESDLGSPLIVHTSPGVTCLRDLKEHGLDFKAPTRPFSPCQQKCSASSTVRIFGSSQTNSSPRGSTFLSRRALPLINDNASDQEEDAKVMSMSDDEETHSPDNVESPDGFDICRLRFLDSETDSPKPVASEKLSECESPLLGSLISSKMVISKDDDLTQMLKAATEGSSPLLASQPHGPTRSYSLPKLKRCTSMVRSQDLGPLRTLSTVLELSPTEFKACNKRPVPFLDDDVESQNSISKKKRMGEVPPRPPCQKLNLQLESLNLPDTYNLTADRSRKLVLPTVLGNSNNRDLNNIDSETLADLMEGKFKDQVESFRVIDARFIFEFKGGHIRGAENFGSWNEEDFLAEFFPSSLGPKTLACKESFSHGHDLKRRILIFHCEFSSVRGPKLMRFLRERDRDQNRDSYPALHYPEVYLLHGGYKAFFGLYPHLCEPQSYIPMNHPEFIKEERKFHKRSRTWQAGGSVSRTGLLQFTRGQSKRDLEKYKRSVSDSLCPGKKSLFKTT